jgi:putative membrane-bound dehydrogenase-like protein
MTTETIDVAWPLPDVAATSPALRYVDLNGDGKLDLVYSDTKRYSAHLWVSRKAGWTQLLAGERDRQATGPVLPPIARDDGSDNGFFVKDQHLCWINESTDALPDFIVRVAFGDLLGDRQPDPKTPDAARATMIASAGFRVELVAHEPRVMDPVALDWGPDGRMWVAEMADYPRGMDDNGKPGGRVRYLEDLNGDGIYDGSVLFLEDVPFPNGVIPWKKGVLISAAPDVIYAEDTNGDGRADVKKVLFTGFAEGNQQHRANGFSRGLDNWLYMANGDSGGTVRAVASLSGKEPDGKAIDIRGRDLRIRPDTGEIEAIEGQTQFGRNRDDWGNWFGNNNSRPMWHYLLEDHYLRRNSNLIVPNLQRDVSVEPGAAPVFPISRTLTRFNDFHTANRFTSACSAMVYRDSVIGVAGPGVAANVFICEPVHNLVHREQMSSEGMSVSSRRVAGEEQSEFLASTDNWFRPTQVKAGPDGALYVADMYRLVIEHPQWIPIEWQRKLNLRAGDDMGRIWRVVPVHGALHKIPRLDKMTVPQLVQVLGHPSGLQRDMAQQQLIDRADPASIPLLVAAATAPGGDAGMGQPLAALGRIHALCTLDGLMAQTTLREAAAAGLTKALPVALSDQHPSVKRHAIRICENFPTPPDEIWKGLVRQVDEFDPHVRVQLAYTLGQLKHPDAGKVLGRLAVSRFGIRPRDEAPRDDPYFNMAVISSVNSTNLGQVLTEVMQTRFASIELMQQLLAQATAFNDEASLVTLLTAATETASGDYEHWQYQAVEQFLISLDRRFTTLDKWLKDLSPQARPVAARLQGLFEAARRLAANDKAPLESRVVAMRVLGRTADANADVTLLGSLIAPQHSPEVQGAALATLGKVRTGDVARILLDHYRSLAPGHRSQASDILLSRDAWRDELLSALESGAVTAADLDAATRQRLLDSRSKGAAARAAKVLTVDLNSNRAKLVADYLPTVRTGGDPQHGSQLFRKMCSQCHKLGDVGHAVGPDLISLTDKSPDAMTVAVLDPNRAVETKFLTFTVITKAGVTHTGLMAAETATSITLRAAEGKETTLLRSEIEELQSNAKSLMPEGLERDLKPADAAALIAYIRLNVPLPAMKTFPGSDVKVVAPVDDGTFVLQPTNAEIYGPTIVVEEKYRNLGWWSSADDIVIWTINVPKPGTYTVRWNYACDPTAAGNRVVVDAAGKSLSHRVDKTGSWDDYQDQSIGELELPAGEVRITMKPASRPLPALADVKTVMLSPKK